MVDLGQELQGEHFRAGRRKGYSDDILHVWIGWNFDVDIDVMIDLEERCARDN